jgi:hypothetical protein
MSASVGASCASARAERVMEMATKQRTKGARLAPREAAIIV